jgi:hypothetical protein
MDAQEIKLNILVAEIEKLEGFGRTGTIPTRCNNPGDLMYFFQAFATQYPVVGVDGKTRIYAKFDTLIHGLAALKRQIALDASAARHETLEQFINKYAPPSDGNNTSAYLAGVMRALGVTDKNTLLGEILA